MRKSDMEVLFSSDKMDWGTPQEFFDKLNSIHNFNLDPCASADTAKCERYYTESDNGLEKDWSEGATADSPVSAFVNPPYGTSIKYWIKKSYLESRKPYTKVVMLVPARTDTSYWHEYCMKADKIHFVKGRLKFGGATAGAPFPSAVVIFDKGNNNSGACHCFTMER